MENLTLTMSSERTSNPIPSQDKSTLIRRWLTKLATNAGQGLDAKTMNFYQALWLEGLEDLEYGVLEAALKKTLQECRFWPVKVADIRQHADHTREMAVAAAADVEWSNLLDYLQEWVNPDMQESLNERAPKLSERVDRAARAAGGLNHLERCSLEDLKWAKKRFLESYIAWDRLEQDQFLLPDGELKNLVAGGAETKALPSAGIPFEELYERGLENAKRTVTEAWPNPTKQRTEYQVVVSPEALDRIAAQKAALREKGLL